MRSLTKDNSNEAPITKAEWALFHRIRSAANEKYTGFAPSHLPLDRVLVEFSYTSHVRRWQQHRLRGQNVGEGYHTADWAKTIFGSLRRDARPRSQRIDVKKDIGPWNAELRRMFAELKDNVGERAIWAKILNPGNWAPSDLTDLVKSAAKQELLRPALPSRPTLSEDKLALARKVVLECRRTGQHTTGVPSSRSFFQKIFG